MHKCSFIFKREKMAASGNHGSNKLRYSGGLIPWARPLGEVFPDSSHSWAAQLKFLPCESREFPSASQEALPLIPAILQMEAQNCRSRDLGDCHCGRRGWVYRLDAHTVVTTATQDFCQAAPCRFPDEKTLCEQFALPKESLSGRVWNHCPLRDVATLFVSSPGSGTAEGPQLCWERNEIYSQGERVGKCIHTPGKGGHFGWWLYFFLLGQSK